MALESYFGKNISRPPLLLFFALSLFALFFSPLFLPSIRLTVFAPFLAILFQRKSLLISLWIAMLCGLLIDLCSSDTHFGIFALCNLCTAGLTYRFRHFFFEENPFSIPLNTMLISITLSLTQLFLVQQPIPFHPQWILASFFLMPLVDALYAFFWFTCPRMLYNRLRRVS